MKFKESIIEGLKSELVKAEKKLILIQLKHKLRLKTIKWGT